MLINVYIARGGGVSRELPIFKSVAARLRIARGLPASIRKDPLPANLKTDPLCYK